VVLVCFRKIEEWLNGFWEGLFRKTRNQVEPVEIARALARELELQKRISVSRVYAPNVFIVSLGKSDFEKFAPLQEPLSRELEEFLLKRAREKGFTFIGRPQITFCEDQNLQPGEIRVNTGFAVSEEQERLFLPDGDEETGQTMVFDLRNSGENTGEVVLVVAAGPDQGKRFFLKRGERYILGRRATCQIVLTDPTVSREHALLEWRDGELYLTDLKSKNGTYVNGSRIVEHCLQPGDQIQVGENLLEFEGD